MNTEVPFTSLATAPSDYDCQDGQLAAAVNLISEDGALRPIPDPAAIATIPDGYTLLFVHKTSSGDNYILGKPTDNTANIRQLSYVPAATPTATPTVIDTGTFGITRHINAVGNTLVAMNDWQMCYILWRNNTYTYLGDQIPNISLSFGLVGYPRFYSVTDSSHDAFGVDLPRSIRTGDNQDSIPELPEGTLDDLNKTSVTEQVMAKVNKFLREQSIEKGRFALPFFLRYAIRLYDGTLVKHSAPMLMNPATDVSPKVWIQRFNNNLSDGVPYTTKLYCDIMLVPSEIDYYALFDATYRETLNKWSDIIKSVDIFVSKPIYTWDQEGQCKQILTHDDLSDTKFIGKLYCSGVKNGSQAEEDKCFPPFRIGPSSSVLYNNSAAGFSNQYLEWPYSYIYALYKSSDHSIPSTYIPLPEFSEEKVRESIQDCSTFYKLKSVAIENIPSSRTILSVPEDYLQSLEAREAMTDDYRTHERRGAKSSYVYNSRLNLSGVKRRLSNGFHLSAMQARLTGAHLHLDIDDTTKCVTIYPEATTSDTTVFVFLRDNGSTYGIRSTYQGAAPVYFHSNIHKAHNERCWGCYVFYPDPNAFKMIIAQGGSYYQIDLKPHDFLNGAYALLNYNALRMADDVTFPTTVNSAEDDGYANVWVDAPNKVYTSEVNNPFFFPATGINTVGFGDVLALSSAAKALSQGQFGQFPLYAFTTEGVWALETNSQGIYTARQPITRDVLLSGSNPLQLDSSVLFPTARGLMLLSGSQVQCISDDIRLAPSYSVKGLPGLTSLPSSHLLLIRNATGDAFLPIDGHLSQEFLEGANLIYDYTHSHIIVSRPDKPLAFVYSLKSQAWSMMQVCVKTPVNSYPDALAVLSDNTLVNFATETGNSRKGFAITRPVKLGDANTLKTIDTAIIRGHFSRGDVQAVLYGSRDLYKWHTVWSSRDHFLRGFHGTPYKYFRVLTLTDLSPEQSLSATSVQFEPRLTGRPR